MARGEADDIDAVLGERFVDVVAPLLAFVGFEGGSVMGRVHRVQSQDDAFHNGEDVLVAGLAQPGKLTLEGVEDLVGRRQKRVGKQLGHAGALRIQGAGGKLRGFLDYA
ncbi:hypothetical protein, partial [Streptomyces nigra]